MPRPVTFLVDASMYGPAYTPPRSLYGDLDRVVRPDLYYHYATPVCAQRWLDVCDDPQYGHAQLLLRVAQVAPEVARALRDDSGGRRRLTLTSLGPGDGAVDESMLGALARELEVTSYLGLDFSFELLRRSVHRIAGSAHLPAGIAVSAVCGDFTALGSMSLGGSDRDVARLFTLMGFTLGNYREATLLGPIRALMREGDYLLLDARMHGLGPVPRVPEGVAHESFGVARGYDLESVRQFVFGPVEVATLASADDVAFGFEPTRSLTVVPGALNLVIYCTGLDTRLRLTGELVRRDRLDLAVTTAYHSPDLESWLAASGFRLVWSGTDADVGFFLLRR